VTKAADTETVALNIVVVVYILICVFMLRPWMRRIGGGTIPKLSAPVAWTAVVVSALIGEGAGRATESIPVGFAVFATVLGAASMASAYRIAARRRGPPSN
jgi:hypothetical protein